MAKFWGPEMHEWYEDSLLTFGTWDGGRLLLILFSDSYKPCLWQNTVL